MSKTGSWLTGHPWRIVAALVTLAAVVLWLWPGAPFRGERTEPSKSIQDARTAVDSEAGSGVFSEIADSSPTSRAASLPTTTPRAGSHEAQRTGEELGPSAERLVPGEARSSDGPEALDRDMDQQDTQPRRVGSARLVFVVLDGYDAALRGATVTLSGAAETPAETSNLVSGRDGVAVFEDLLAGSYHYVVAAPDRPILAAASVLELGADEERVIELQIPEFDQVLRGQVVDQDGAGVPDLGVLATARALRPFAGDLSPTGPRRTRTSSDGSFVVTELAAGEYELSTVASDTYPSASALVRTVTDTVVLRVVENDEFRLSGVVTDALGEPLAGVRVVPIGHSPSPVLTDADGVYELPLLIRRLEGAYAVSFRLAGYIEQRFTLEGKEIEARRDLRLDVVLDPIERTVEVAGRLATTGGMPVPDEVVHLHSPTTQTRYQARSDRDGWFVFPEVAASSDYTLGVRPRSRFRDLSIDGLDLSADRAPLEVMLEELPYGTVRGVMVDFDGKPVPGFRLGLRNARALAHSIEVIGDASGYFELRDVPAGPLSFQSSSLPRFRIGVLELEAGQDASVELVLDVGDARLEGQVLDSADNPVAGAQVELTWNHVGVLRSSSVRQSLTGENGTFAFTGISRGGHTVEARAPGLSSQKIAVPVGESWLEIRLVGAAESP